MCKPTEAHTREGQRERQGPDKLVKFGTYNIRNGRNGGLKSALYGMAQGKVDVGVLHETKITDDIYTR